MPGIIVVKKPVNGRQKEYRIFHYWQKEWAET
jgi:hypothetical protein